MTAQTRASPYKGLLPYDEADAAYFFGRDAETRLIVANLFAAPLTLLYGPTGVGKTSVLEAGVMPQLRKRERVIGAAFRAWQTTDDCAGGIKEAIARAVPEPVEPDAGESLVDYLQRVVDRLGFRVMLILDQFEEYFVASSDGAFDRELVTTVNRRDLPISVLLSIREDALATLDRYQGSMPSLFQNYLRLDHLDRAGAAAAITKPLAVYNQEHGTAVRAEDELADAVLAELEPERLALDRPAQLPAERRRGRIETPYLQLVLERLWTEEEALGSSVLRVETLRRLGGADRIVRTYLDDGLAALGARDRDVAARIFRYLVTPSGTKIALLESDLAEWGSLDPSSLHPVLEALARDEWVLRRTTPQSAGGAARYEIVHDYLAPAILRWRQTYLAERQSRRRRRYVVAVAAAALAAAGAGFAVLAVQLAQQKDKAESAQANLRKVVPSGRVLRLTRPILKGPDVQAAQYLLSSNNVFRTAFYPRSRIDGEFGPRTARAARDAKYWLGYPNDEIEPTFDDKLRAFLLGSKDLPQDYAARRADRLRRAAPANPPPPPPPPPTTTLATTVPTTGTEQTTTEQTTQATTTEPTTTAPETITIG